MEKFLILMMLLWYLIGSAYLDSGLPSIPKNDSCFVLLLALVMIFCHFLFHWRVWKLITVGKIFIFINKLRICCLQIDLDC